MSSSSDIPLQKIPMGISMCNENAKRLLDAANAYLSARYGGPGPLSPQLYGEIRYGSGCGLAILALEETGKGFFLLKKHRRGESVSRNAWNRITSDRGAHLEKIREVQELLSSTESNLASKLNTTKLRDLYVDWRDGDWKSPSYPEIEKKDVTDILLIAEKAHSVFEEMLKNDGIMADPWSQEYYEDLRKRGAIK